MATEALREMFIAIGYAINPSGLAEADARADAFRDNLLAAESQGQQLGAAMRAMSQTASTSMEQASNAAAGLAGWWAANQDRVEGWGNQLKELRPILAGTAAITGGLIATSVKTAANFEAAMSRVAAVSRASDEDLERLTKTAIELGASTAFSASQAAEGMTYLAMAGFDVNQTIAAMPGLLNTAAAAGSDLGRTADIVSNILSGFGLRAEETTRIADVLAATFTSSNTTLESLGETMKLVAPVAATLGMEIEDVAALTAVLGDAGIQGSMAGTALRTILTSLAAPTGAAAEALERLRIETVDAAGNMRPITAILEDIAVKTAHMGDAQRAAVLEMLAGRQGVSALAALMSVGSARIDEYAQSLRNSAGVAAEVAGRMMDNLKGAMEELGGAIETAQITIGNAFVPVLRLGAQSLGALINVFNRLPGPVQTAIAVGLGAVAMLSTMALTASFLIPQIGTVVKGFTVLKADLMTVGAAGAKAGAAIAAAWLPVTLTIMGVVAAALLLQDVWMYLRGEGDTLTGRAIAWAKTFGETLPESLGRYGTVLKVVGGLLAAVFGPRLIYVSGVAAGRFAVSMARAAVNTAMLGVQGAKASVGIVRMGAQLLLAGVRHAAMFTGGISRAGIALSAQLLGGLAGATRAALAFNAALLANPMTWVLAGIIALGLGIYYLVRNWDKATARIGEIWASVSASVGGAIDGIIEWFATLPDRTMERLSGWWEGIRAWFVETFNFGQLLSEAFSAAMELIPGPLRGLAETIMGFFPRSPAKQGPLAELDQVGAGMVEELARGIQHASPSELEAAIGDIGLPARAVHGGSPAVATALPGLGGVTQTFQVNVTVDARGAGRQDAETIGQITADKIREVLEEYFRAEYHAVALQGV